MLDVFRGNIGMTVSLGQDHDNVYDPVFLYLRCEKWYDESIKKVNVFMVKIQKEISRNIVCEKYGRGIEEVIFEDEVGDEHEFYIKKEGNSVCVLAITEDNLVIMTRQFRHGPKKILLELPGGGVNRGEDVEEAMTRELLEETGYAGDMQFVTCTNLDGYSTGYRNCFVATNCKKVQGQDLDEKEYIDIVLLSLKEFREHLRSGELTDVEVGYLGLDYLNLL